MSALFRPIALLKLLHWRSSFEYGDNVASLMNLFNCRSSIFNDYIENGVKFESLDLPRKEEEAVGFIAIQFIKNLQHGCNGLFKLHDEAAIPNLFSIKPDVVKKCLEDGIPKPVEYEHKGLARSDTTILPLFLKLFNHRKL